MSTVTKKGIKNATQHTGIYGNAWKQNYTFQTNASGIMTDSDLTTAVQSGDKIRLGILPAGLELHTSLDIVSDAFTAATTADIGFEYVDGEDSASVPQDADYFDAALATDAQGRTAAANLAVAPVRLPKDAYLILTIGGAAHAAAGRLDVIIEGIYFGPPSS